MPVNGWVDVHAHFMPPISGEQAQANLEAMHRLCFMAPRPHVWEPDVNLAYMDDAGIAMQLLSNVPTDHESLRASNDYGTTLVAEHPDRYGLLAAVPSDDLSAALAEIERASAFGPDGWALSTT